jgi:archaellum biogenesis protein FlaJ (TadC family)
MIPDIVAYIAVGVMGVLGLLMVIAPGICTRADKRNDTKEVEKIRKAGLLVLAVTAGAALFILKYSRR